MKMVIGKYLLSIDGCSRLLNEHTQFNGLAFNQADTLIEGVPEWMECSIYRRDRIMPITVREYFVEVRNGHEMWQKMPRRMLRHKSITAVREVGDFLVKHPSDRLNF
jgi:hypothetical protein